MYKHFSFLEGPRCSNEDLVVCVTEDDSLESCEEKRKSILADRKEELFEAKDLARVWGIFSNYFSYFNYYLIEQVIGRFGTEEDKQNLTEYKQSFTEFTKQSFRKCPADGFGIQNETDCVIIVKLGEQKYDDCTLSQLEQFILELSRILDLSDGVVLCLCRILPGCIELTLLAPSFVESAVFPLSPDQEAALKALGVIQLQCGDYRYPSEDKDDSSEVDQDDDSDGEPPSSPESDQLEYSGQMPLQSKTSPGSHSDSGIGTLTTTNTNADTSKSSATTISSDVLNIHGSDTYQPTESSIPRFVSAITEATQKRDSKNILQLKIAEHFAVENLRNQDFDSFPPLHQAAYRGELVAVNVLKNISVIHWS